MSDTAPPHRGKIIAVVLVLVIIGAALGTYLVLHNPLQATTTTATTAKLTGHGFAVESNKVVLVKFPGFNYSGGIWQLQLSNNGNSKQFVTYQLLENGNLANGNSSTLQAGQRSNATACLNFATESSTYRVSIFVSNSSGTFSKDYPVATQNATQTQYSGQFSATNKLSASASSWSVTITNAGTKPIGFAYAELWNSTKLLSALLVVCAGESYLNNYAQPLNQGQSASDTRLFFPSGSTVIAGKTYKVDVAAVYSDFSEVIQSYTIQATG
jgi:hypothetical protein